MMTIDDDRRKGGCKILKKIRRGKKRRVDAAPAKIEGDLDLDHGFCYKEAFFCLNLHSKSNQKHTRLFIYIIMSSFDPRAIMLCAKVCWWGGGFSDPCRVATFSVIGSCFYYK
jgi:hypothetical protein